MPAKRVYCKYCGAKLRRDPVGQLCPTKNCQWQHGLPKDEDTPAKPRKARSAGTPGEHDNG